MEGKLGQVCHSGRHNGRLRRMEGCLGVLRDRGLGHEPYAHEYSEIRAGPPGSECES